MKKDMPIDYDTKISKNPTVTNLVFTFTGKEISDFLGLKARSLYNELDNISQKLMSHMIIIKNGVDFFEKIRIIPYSIYENGLFKIRFDQSMEKYLLELKSKFTIYGIENIRYLKSNYSLRIYEVLKSYEWIEEKIFELDELKRTIGVKAFLEDKKEWIDLYPRYYDFKKRILTVSQKELAEKTDIKFNFEEIKTGQRVTSIKFEIQKNPNNILEQVPISHSKKEKKIKNTTPN